VVPRPAGAARARPDTPGAAAWQGRDIAEPRTHAGALVVLRAAYIVGQGAILLVTWRLLAWPFPLGPCLALMAVSATFNLCLFLSPAIRLKAPASVAANLWVAGQLAFDILEMAGLLHFTGGVVNPFAMLLVAPVIVAGGALPPAHALGLCALSILAAVALCVTGAPVGPAGPRLACLSGLVIAMAFAGGYSAWSSAESARRELARHVAETVLAREQRLSALGALAAAVAHELGTPLATITIIAAELAREAPAGAVRDDATLLVEQTKRCRDILKRVAETPEREDSLHERMSLLQFVGEIVAPYAGDADVRVEALVTGPTGVDAPDLWRRPEILHAITAFVENAVDFARGEILLTARFDAETVTMEVRDDGPGFAPAVLGRLGEAYVTSRPGAEGSRTGHVGMGLGLFIAKTLLERSGGQVTFANGARAGAVVTARWPRDRIEARV
jgi:two-component system sensor histidine kinase RegB